MRKIWAKLMENITVQALAITLIVVQILAMLMSHLIKSKWLAPNTNNNNPDKAIAELNKKVDKTNNEISELRNQVSKYLSVVEASSKKTDKIFEGIFGKEGLIASQAATDQWIKSHEKGHNGKDK